MLLSTCCHMLWEDGHFLSRINPLTYSKQTHTHMQMGGVLANRDTLGATDVTFAPRLLRVVLRCNNGRAPWSAICVSKLARLSPRRSPPRPRRRRTPAVLLLQIAGTLERGKWNGVEGLRITIMPRYSSVLCVRRPERASLIGWNINMKR